MKSCIALTLLLAGLSIITHAHGKPGSTSQARYVCAGAVLDAPEGSLRLLTDAEIAATEVLLNDANENGGTPVAPCTKAVVVQKACSLVIPIVDDDGNVTGSETYFNYAAKSQIKCIGKGGKTTNTFFSSDFTIAEPDPVTV